MRFWVALLLAFGLALPAHAEWHEAQSEHFIIYSDSRSEDVRDFAVLLERYHALLAMVTGMQTEPPSPSGRVTIYAVGSDRNLRELYGNPNSAVASFYLPRASGSAAFIPNLRIRGGERDFSLSVLLHEYAHHFLISGSRHAMPRWISEGAAEFFGSAELPSEGKIVLGSPPLHRRYELAFADDVSAEELLDHKLYEANRGRKYDSFYARSWGLYHFLTFDEQRRGQVGEYLRALRGGLDPRAAAEAAFGDLDQLDRDLRDYMRQKRFSLITFQPDAVKIGPVSVRELDAGMQEMMPVILRSKRGVNADEALGILTTAREVAARFPREADVLAALAEAEFDAGNDTEAIAAADRAIAIDPSVKNAYVQKGYALFHKAEHADDANAAYAAAMKPFEKLNAIENDHPLPLIHYYRSFVARGEMLPESARHALERASELAPFDKSLAMNAAIVQAAEGELGLARRTLAPLAADPHGGQLADRASALIAAMEKAAEGKPFHGGAIEADLPGLGDAGEDEDEK